MDQDTLVSHKRAIPQHVIRARRESWLVATTGYIHMIALEIINVFDIWLIIGWKGNIVSVFGVQLLLTPIRYAIYMPKHRERRDVQRIDTMIERELNNQVTCNIRDKLSTVKSEVPLW